MTTPAAGQRWCWVASAPPALLSQKRYSPRARLGAAALNGGVVVLDNAKRLALSSATGLLALSSVALGTYAGFSAQVSNPGDTFATGSVKIDAYVGSPNTPSGTGNTFGFGQIDDLLPGEPIVRFLDIENTGTLPVAIAMTSNPVSGTAGVTGSSLNIDQSNGLKLEVKRCTTGPWTAPDTCTGGSGSALHTGIPIAPFVDPADLDDTLSLGIVQPGAVNTGRYQLRVTMPDTTTSRTFTSQTSTIQFTWTASNTTP